MIMKRNKSVWYSIFSGATLGCLCLIVPDPVHGFDLTTPFLLENTQTLPRGVRNPRMIQVFVSGESRFDGVGVREPIGARLSKNVSWNDVLGSQKTETERNIIQTTLREAQINLDGGPGRTTGQVYTTADVKVPTLAYGLTDRLTLAVVVPVMSVSVSADTSLSRSEEGQRWMDRICAMSVDDCNTAAKKLNNAVNEKLSRLGYETIPSFKNVSAIGDVQVVGKYVLHKNNSDTLALKSTVVLPTGKKPNANAALDIPTGDGRFQLGSMLIYDKNLPAHFRWNTFGGALALMPHSLERRVPTSNLDALSQDSELLTRRLGGVFSLGTSLNYSIASWGLSTGLGYSMQYLTQTSYSGRAFSQERYQYLQDLTPSETLHTGIITAGFSTVEWYKNKQFFYPFQANVTYSRPLAGRNVNASEVVAGELVLFF